MFGFLKSRKVDPRAALKKACGDYDLPSFPAVALRILEVLRDPNATTRQVSDTLAADPGLTVRVLRTVNSSAFAPRTRIESLSHAVAMMGMAAIESLVMSVAVASALPRDVDGSLCNVTFWRSAGRRAVLARGLAGLLHPATAAQSFTSGLLQDMAVPLLAASRGEDYGDVLSSWRSGSIDLARLETEALGWNHAEVATWLCNEWGLPETLAATIGGHHETDEELPCPPAVTLVARLKEVPEKRASATDRDGTDDLIETARDRYGLCPDAIIEMIAETEDAGDKLAEMMI